MWYRVVINEKKRNSAALIILLSDSSLERRTMVIHHGNTVLPRCWVPSGQLKKVFVVGVVVFSNLSSFLAEWTEALRITTNTADSIAIKREKHSLVLLCIASRQVCTSV